MPSRIRRGAFVALPAGALLLSLALVPSAAAHTGIEVGPFLLDIGWRNEPALVGQPNAVQVTIVVHDTNKPVLDLGADDLQVVVSTAGVDSPALAFVPAFDASEGAGPLGEYNAALVPTAPGDYTFHITGVIRKTAVDVTLASSDGAFDPVAGTSELEFPAKLPNLTEVGTRLDRIDGRIAALQSADPGTAALAAAQSAEDAAKAAEAAADRVLLVAIAGVILALVALIVAIVSGRKRGAGSA